MVVFGQKALFAGMILCLGCIFCALPSAQARGRVAVVVTPAVAAAVPAELTRFQDDLAEYGYSPVLIEFPAFSSPIALSEAAALKAQLLALYAEPQSLEGAVLIGNLPYIRFEMNQPIDPSYELFVCDLYFMDMTGTWEDILNDGLVQPNNTRYDTWTDGARPTIEIWVSRIRADNLSLFGTETEILTAYFDRNHTHRPNVMNADRGLTGLIYNDDDWSSTYAWVNPDIANVEKTLGQGSATAIYLPNATTAADFLTNRITDGYHYIMLRSHGKWSTTGGGMGYHKFFRNNYSIDEYIYADDYVATPPMSQVYSIYICQSTNFNSSNYLAGAFVLNPLGEGLIGWGSSKTGGLTDEGIFYDAVVDRANFGSAFVYWFNTTSALQGYSHYGMILIGDASLGPMPVNYYDFARFAEWWKYPSGCNFGNDYCGECDVTSSTMPGWHDGKVDMYDLVYYFQNWMQ